MDIYTLGKLALPVVVGIMAVAAVLTLAMGIFTAVKTLENVAAFLPAHGRKPAVLGHDQHHPRKTVFQTSHAGTGMSSPDSTRSGAAWVRLNFLHEIVAESMVYLMIIIRESV